MRRRNILPLVNFARFPLGAILGRRCSTTLLEFLFQL
jgi:hypothetical protein